MPPRPEDKGKSKGRRRRYNTHVADPATLATLIPFPAPPLACSQGSIGSSQVSVAAPTRFNLFEVALILTIICILNYMHSYYNILIF